MSSEMLNPMLTNILRKRQRFSNPLFNETTGPYAQISYESDNSIYFKITI